RRRRRRGGTEGGRSPGRRSTARRGHPAGASRLSGGPWRHVRQPVSRMSSLPQAPRSWPTEHNAQPQTPNPANTSGRILLALSREEKHQKGKQRGGSPPERGTYWFSARLVPTVFVVVLSGVVVPGIVISFVVVPYEVVPGVVDVLLLTFVTVV